MTATPTVGVIAPLILAHAGHWAVDLMFTAPVFVLFVWLWIQSIRDKRRGPRDRSR